jgi:hypothetical protein
MMQSFIIDHYYTNRGPVAKIQATGSSLKFNFTFWGILALALKKKHYWNRQIMSTIDRAAPAGQLHLDIIGYFKKRIPLINRMANNP